MAGLLSKGIKFYYNSATTSTPTWTEVVGLQEIPDLGGAPEKVDVTTLADGNYKYIAGIKDFGDLEFTFLYDNSEASSNYRVLKGLEGAVKDWKVEFPDALSSGTGTHHGTEFTFSGEPTVIISGMGVNAPAQFRLNVALNSDIAVSNPA